jgi:hypothetical protein
MMEVRTSMPDIRGNEFKFVSSDDEKRGIEIVSVAEKPRECVADNKSHPALG